MYCHIKGGVSKLNAVYVHTGKATANHHVIVVVFLNKIYRMTKCYMGVTVALSVTLRLKAFSD